MELQSLKVNTRAGQGKGAARQLRRDGGVPGVLYGGANDAVSIQVNARDLDNLLPGSQGEQALIELEVADKPELNGPAMVKAVQHHPVRGQVIHTDFLRIDLTKRIQTRVAISILGQSKGVIDGGVIDRYGLFNYSIGRTLPHPATYVIDHEGTVRWRFVEKNFRERASPEDVWCALEAVHGTGACCDMFLNASACPQRSCRVRRFEPGFSSPSR